MNPERFELLLRAYLTAIGTSDLRFIRQTRTLDTSVRGTLIIEQLFQIPIVVYVHRRPDYTVTALDIADRRSELGPHELAVVISLAGFDHDALDEVRQGNAFPLALLNGNDFAKALVKHRIGIEEEQTETFVVGLHS